MARPLAVRGVLRFNILISKTSAAQDGISVKKPNDNKAF
jgi:hypothetical protein